MARAPADEPFTSGIYRFSRHPMYLSMILVYLAVSTASSSWVFLLITAATARWFAFPRKRSPAV